MALRNQQQQQQQQQEQANFLLPIKITETTEDSRIPRGITVL